MNDRPVLNKHLDGDTFRSYYYLKEELTAFCRQNGIPASGGKLELTDRIAKFLLLPKSQKQNPCTQK